MRLRTLIPTAAAALALAGSALAAPDTTTVAQGALHGQVTAGVASFKGVPFAAPPEGEWRWRPPQAPKAWSGLRDATRFGAVCTQTGRTSVSSQPQSEDCLFLNVWAPAGLKPGAKLPVMVWIHGGGFTGGGGSAAGYDGAAFARSGVVLITVNYRLGRLGFFAHPALAAQHPGEPQGNYGLMDTIAALKWVKANAAAFGGDPANVTVFGESAGGYLVNFLMASPQAKGLFAKAISESGFGRPASATLTAAEAIGARWAATQGVNGSGPEAAKALHALTPEQLAAPSAGLLDPGMPKPMIDGVVAVENPDVAFAAGHEAKVPYIAGGNSFEASLFADLVRASGLVISRAGALREKVIAAYGGPSDMTAVATDFTTETAIIEPDRMLAREHVRHGQKAWLYYMSYLPAAQRGKVHGVPHAGEIPYVFGNLTDEPSVRGGVTTPAAMPADHAVSDKIHAYWVAFAKASDPDSAGGVAWPAYDLATEPVLEFGADGIQPRPQFHKASLDLLEQIATAGGGR